MKIWALLCVFFIQTDEALAGRGCEGEQCSDVAPSHARRSRKDPTSTAVPEHGKQPLSERQHITPHPTRSHSRSMRTRHHQEEDRPDGGEDHCSGLYSGCHHIHRAIAFIEDTGSFCPKLLENPEKFVTFLKNKSVHWTPFENRNCSDGRKFCPLEFKKDGCIPIDANCTGSGAMRPRNGSDPEGDEEEADGDEGDGEDEGDDDDEEPADHSGNDDDDEEQGDENETPWHDRCPGNTIYCRILAQCTSNRRLCSIQRLTAWIALNNSRDTPFNESCPADTRYCLTEGRCISVNVKCHDVERDFNGTCNSSDRFCYSRFRCIPKGKDCPSQRFPRGLRHALLMKHPGQVKNETYRVLVKTGWARFCFLNKALHALHFRAQQKCDRREDHCRREGPDGHKKCLDAKNRCSGLIKDRRVCTKGFNYCKILRNDSDGFASMLKRIVHEKPQGGKCPEHRPNFCPLSRDCIRANGSCTDDERDNRTKTPEGEESNRTKCDEGLQFCEEQHSCLTHEDCRETKSGNFSSVDKIVRDSGWPEFCRQRKSICAHLENSLGKCRPSDDACSVRDRPRCQHRLRFCSKVNACIPRDECDCPEGEKPCRNRCVSIDEHCGASPYHRASRTGERPGHKASRTDEKPGHKASRTDEKPGHRASRTDERPGHKASRTSGKPHPARSRTKPDGHDRSIAVRQKLDMLFLKVKSRLKDMFKTRKPVYIGITDAERSDGTWKFRNDKGGWEDFGSCSDGQVLAMHTDTRARFFPNGGFHGVVNFTIYTLKNAEAGECVQAEGDPAAVVLYLVFPNLSGIKISLIEPEVYIDEDEEDRTGKKLSSIFNVTWPDVEEVILDESITKYIPEDILSFYETLNSNFDKLRAAIYLVTPMDPRLGTTEYKESFGWATFPSGSMETPLVVDLNATSRIFPRVDKFGRTKAKVRAAVWLPQKHVPNLDAVPPNVKKIINKIKDRITDEKFYKLISFVVSLFGQQQDIIFRAAEELSRHFSRMRVGPQDFRAFIKGVHSMRLPASQGDCMSVSFSKICYLGEMEVNLTIIIRPVDDPPKVVDSDGVIVFPPVPFDMSTFPEEGVSVKTLTKTNNKLLALLINHGFGEKALEFMANGDDVQELRSNLPSRLADSPRAKRFATPLFSDEKSAVCIVIYDTGRPSFGTWNYKINGSWQNLTVHNSKEAIEAGERLEVIFLNLDDRLKFEPNEDNTVWTRFQADDTFLLFKGWDCSDNSMSGKRVVNMSDISGSISEDPLYMTVDKVGCDRKPGSMAVADSCGKCNGRDACIGCDGKKNSSAKYDNCGQCVGGQTGRKPHRDCAGSCENTSYTDECGVCQARGRPRRVKDCNNVCRGARGYGAKPSCGKCVGGTTGQPIGYGKDSCGKCNGNNESCTDCLGVVGGNHTRDSCNECRSPDDDQYNACVKLAKARPTSAHAQGGTVISVRASGLRSKKVAKCWFQDKQDSKHEQDVVNIRQNSFEFKLKQIPAGRYALKCTFDDGNTEYEYDNEKFSFFGDDTEISSASPNETEISNSVNVTLNGAGFVNTSALVCVLGVSRAKFVTYKAVFVSSTQIVCYLVRIEYSGALKLGVSFSGKGKADSIVDFSVYAVAPVPVGNAQFSDDLRYVKVTLDKRAQPRVGCGHFFASASLAKFGNRPKCFVRDIELRIYLFGRYALKPGDNITFLLNGLQRKNAGLTKRTTGNDEKELTVIGPENSVPLQIDISGSTEVGPCDSFKFWVNSNKKGLQFTWFVRFDSDSGITNIQKEDLKALNETLLNQTKHKVEIKENYVKSGIECSLHVQAIEHVSSQMAEASVVIKREEIPIPKVYFKEKNYNIKASSQLKLRGNVKLSPCMRKSDNYGVEFLWDYDHPELKVVENKAAIRIKKGWSTGQAHTFTLRVTMLSDRSLTTSASVVVNVEEEPLKAIIRGGVFVTVGQEEPLTLDGCNSNDPNDSPTPEMFVWECKDEDQIPCFVKNSSNHDIEERLILPEQCDVVIAPGLLEPDRKYSFTLTYRKGENASTATVYRKVVHGEAPELVLSDPGKVNPSDKIVITALVNSNLDVIILEWFCEMVDEEGYGFVDLNKAGVLFSAKVNYMKVEKGQGIKRRFKLVFRRNVLSGGMKYRIGVNAYNSLGELKASAYQDVATNAPPSQGIATVEPAEGEAMVTVFVVGASNVFDDAGDMPLSYRCFCKMRKRNKLWVQLMTHSSDSDESEFTLPPGDKKANNTHKCFMEVTDIHGASSKSNDVVITVEQRELNENDVNNGTDDVRRDIGAGMMAAAASKTVSILQALGDGDDLDDAVRDGVKKLKEAFTEEFLSLLANYDPDDQESLISGFLALAKTTEDIKEYNPNLAEQVLSQVLESLRPRIKESDDDPSRRRRAEDQEEVIEVKTGEQVETILDTYANLITPDDYRSSSMSEKNDLTFTAVDLMGKSMCKGMSEGEPPEEAQSKIVVMRSEMNMFEAADTNYTNIACDICEVGVNISAQVLLGRSLKEQYEHWVCSDEGCNGACVVSAQYPDDLLLAKESQDRVSDVIYMKLFNPDTLTPLTVSGLAHPVSFKVYLKSYNASRGEPKCHAWDSVSSNWSTSGVMTGDISSEGSTSFINCSRDELGYISVFLVDAQVVSTTAAATTAAQQNATDAPVKQQDEAVYVKFSLQANYDDYINESTKSDFIDQTKKSIATKLNVNQSRIADVTVQPGSIIVTFKLLPGGPGDMNTSSLVSLLESHVKSGSFVIRFSDGRNFTVDANSFVNLGPTSELPTQQETTIGPTSITYDASGLSDVALIVIIVVSCIVAFAIIVGIIVYVRMKNRRAKVQDEQEERVRMQPMRKDAQSPVAGHVNENVRQEATCEAILPGTPEREAK